MFDMVTNLISERKIPALNELRMEALLHHLFTATPRAVCIQVAEIAYRYDSGHPRAMDVYLASALPLAERAARNRAGKIFVHPSDWQVELMYDGAVKAVIETFQSKCVLKPEGRCFPALPATGYGAGSHAQLFPAKRTCIVNRRLPSTISPTGLPPIASMVSNTSDSSRPCRASASRRSRMRK